MHEPDVAFEDAPSRVQWTLATRDGGGTTLRLRETGFRTDLHRGQNDEGWDAELGELVALLRVRRMVPGFRGLVTEGCPRHPRDAAFERKCRSHWRIHGVLPSLSSATVHSLLGFTAGLLAAWSAACAQSDTQRTAYRDYRVVTVADGFVLPWSIAFLPDGDVLVTEHPGRLRIIRDGVVLPDPVPGIPEVVARGQGGLLEVLPHPDFASNRLIYISYSKATGRSQGGATAVIRAAPSRTTASP